MLTVARVGPWFRRAPERRAASGCVPALLLFAVVLLEPDPAVAAASAALIPSGGCRDGIPNGAFELRAPEGQLRIAGAFHDGRRTGTFLFWDASGSRIAEIPYDEDVPNGTIALWHPAAGRQAPRRRLEEPVRAGRLHGTVRSWFPNGRLRAQADYENGRLVNAKAWGADGHPLPDDAARRRVEEDGRRDAGYLAGLERIVAAHLPRCE